MRVPPVLTCYQVLVQLGKYRPRPLRVPQQHARVCPSLSWLTNPPHHPNHRNTKSAFAGWHVLGKVALNTGVSPLFFALIREAGASLVLLLIAAIVDPKPRLPNKREALVFFVLGALIFVNIVGFILALDLVSPVTAAIYQPLIPVWTALWAVIFKVEAANPYMLMGIALSVTGAIVASMSDSHPHHQLKDPVGTGEFLDTLPDSLGGEATSLEDYSFLGHVILLIQTLALGTMFLVQKQIVHDFPSLTITAWYYTIGSGLTVILCLAWFQSFQLIHEQISYLKDTHVLIAFLYAVVVGTAFTYGGSTWANKRIHATIVSLYTVLQSPFTLLLSICFLGTKPAIQDLFCMVLILLGMVLVVGSKMKEEETSQRPTDSGGMPDYVILNRDD